ncbi:hypothetical protein GOV12_04850, partial [Candidatus Pacearchaeota archaeon]|nr:hypothetical protein [Candidatus Pacearchaeota archaeon]
MVNEDIITSLRNAITHGESLDSAMNTAIASGYSKRDVDEAARYVGGSVISSQNPRSGESLTMPNKRGFFSKKPKNPPVRKRQQQPQQPQQQSQQQPQQP